MPRSPFTGSPTLSTSPFRSASVMNVFLAFHLPVRTSEGANFWKCRGKSMITQPAGLPETSWPASVSKFAWFGFQSTVFPTLPPSAVLLLDERRSAVPKASLRAPMLSVDALVERSSAASREHLALQRVGRVQPPEEVVVLDRRDLRALAVGESVTMPSGIVTDWAIGIVAPEAISPMITFAPCVLISFVAASKEALACVCPSSEPTSSTFASVTPAARATCSRGRPRA